MNPEKIKAAAERTRFMAPLYKSKYQARKSGYVACSSSEQELRQAFTGYCHACGQKEGKAKLHMDHDHVTGDFRGWLCRDCNVALGLLKESKERLLQLMIYIESKEAK